MLGLGVGIHGERGHGEQRGPVPGPEPSIAASVLHDAPGHKSQRLLGRAPRLPVGALEEHHRREHAAHADTNGHIAEVATHTSGSPAH